MTDKIYDIAIIGGGPAGIFAAYYARLRKLDVALIETLPNLGGQPNTLYSQKKIYDIAAIPSITGSELTEQLIEQINFIGCDKFLGTSVSNINQVDDDKWELTTDNDNNKTIIAKSIIIALGNGAFEPRKLTFDYDHELETNNIRYFVNDIEDFRNQDIAIAGGGDSAVDWAVDLNKVSNRTFLIHRRNKYRAMENSVDHLNSSSVEQLNPYIIKDVKPNVDKMDIIMKKLKSDDIDTITVDKLLVNYGFVSDSKILKEWNIDLEGPFIKVNEHMETNLPNVFAIGDIVTYSSKLQLIATAFAEGPIAVTKAIRNIYPERDFFEHSTSLFEN
ncbi:NAD(P)/FAD-dependent oxidoreductase [Companilactobacillus metriopterae]|uniref:NAD(P)/FAD-dependent oxidoreductase n=1 Tax=Companilactobacillus metriopterae TaxID=1909267 RepID=UPI00100AE848|nr:NAD(P)/FAD-dependent oxidoreductase [Companilactobacillus metriopterae]